MAEPHSSCGRILSPRMDIARSVRPRTCWWPPGLLPLWLLLRTWVCEHLSGSLPSLWGTCLGGGLLDHMVVLCWILEDPSVCAVQRLPCVRRQWLGSSSLSTPCSTPLCFALPFFFFFWHVLVVHLLLRIGRIGRNT